MQQKKMRILYVLDSSVAITADRVAERFANNCLMQLLRDMLYTGLLLVPLFVAQEVCGENGRNCNSVACREFCQALKSAEEDLLVLSEEGRDVTQWLSLAYGLDIGEAEAIALALKTLNRGAVDKVIVLTADSAARRAVDELVTIYDRLEAHGDLYLIELAKKLGYCSPREAAEVALSLPRLKRYVRAKVARDAASRLAAQQQQH